MNNLQLYTRPVGDFPHLAGLKLRFLHALSVFFKFFTVTEGVEKLGICSCTYSRQLEFFGRFFQKENLDSFVWLRDKIRHFTFLALDELKLRSCNIWWNSCSSSKHEQAISNCRNILVNIKGNRKQNKPPPKKKKWEASSYEDHSYSSPASLILILQILGDPY